MSSRMLETMSIAIYHTTLGVGPWTLAPEPTRVRCRRMAEAALLALREPNETMAEAGADRFAERVEDDYPDRAIEDAFVAMIDAALAERR